MELSDLTKIVNNSNINMQFIIIIFEYVEDSDFWTVPFRPLKSDLDILGAEILGFSDFHKNSFL